MTARHRYHGPERFTRTHQSQLLRVVVEDAADDVDRGVVHQDLHGSERARDLGDDVVDLRAVAGVHRVPDHGRVREVGGDRGGDLARPPLVDVGDHDPRAAGREPARGRLADPGPGRARHQRDATIELVVHRVLLSGPAGAARRASSHLSN